VNRHGGGAALLEDPELLARIVGAVRRAVPAAMPVSAKMRLGSTTTAARSNARTRSSAVARASWSCMRVPRRMATDRRRTGNGSRWFAPPWLFP